MIIVIDNCQLLDNGSFQFWEFLMNISDTFGERYIIPVFNCYSERIIHDDRACHLKKCCVNLAQKKVTALCPRIWGRWIWYWTSYSSGIMWIDGANPIATPTIEMNSIE